MRVLAQALLVPGVGPDGRPGVRVLVDQILHTFPAAEAEKRAANVNLLYSPEQERDTKGDGRCARSHALFLFMSVCVCVCPPQSALALLSLVR